MERTIPRGHKSLGSGSAHSAAALGGLLALLSAEGACSPATGDQAPLVHLKEVAAVTTPDSFPVSRVEVGTEGRLALLSPLHSHMLVSSGDTLIEFRHDALARPVAVAFGPTPRLITVVDADRHAILIFEGDSLIETITVPGDIEVGGAARSRVLGWVILGTSQSGRRELLVESRGWKPLPANLPTSQDLAAVRFDALVTVLANGGVVVSERGRPHYLLFIDENLQQRQVRVLPDHPFGDSQQWVATGLVNLEGEIMYSVADIRSDERFALLLDSEGALIRMRRWALPIGMAASFPDQNAVLAIRHFRHRELVVYQWRRSDH